MSSNEKRHQSKQGASGLYSKKSFTKVLEDACEAEQTNDIHIFSNGYTKDALPYYHYVNMREYR